MFSQKSPSWLRAAQIGLGALIIVLSIIALASPAITYISIILILAIVLFFVGIEEILVGIFSPGKSRWANIGLGVLVLIFAGLAISYPATTALIIIIFIAVAFLINGIARIIEGFLGKHSGASRAFLVGVGALAIALSIAVLVSPFFGAALAGIVIAVGLLITGIQMVVAGFRGRKVSVPGTAVNR